MAEQAIPNDLLQLIFLELDPVTFIFRKVPKISKHWRYWPVHAVKSLAIHPRGGYKYSFAGIYDCIMQSNMQFKGVKQLSIVVGGELQKPIAAFLSRFPNVERVKLRLNVNPYFSTMIIELPVPNKIIELDYKGIQATYIQKNEDGKINNNWAMNLQVLRGPLSEQSFEYIPPTIKELEIEAAWSTSPFSLTKFTSLTALSVTHHDWPPLKEYLATIPSNLTSLVLKNFTGLNDELLNYIVQLPALKVLVVDSVSAYNWDTSLNKLKDMERIEVTSQVMKYDERVLKNHVRLQSLRLGPSDHLTYLNHLQNLKELDLFKDKLTPTVLNWVLRVKTIEKLRLEGTFSHSKDDEITLAAPNNTIKELTLFSCRNCDEFFQLWAPHFSGLKKVTFNACELPAIKPEFMNGWTTLEKLNIESGQKKAVSYFSELPNLRTFNVKSTLVDDTVFDLLLKCPKLEVAKFLLTSEKSAFIIENKLYGLVKQARCLYYLEISSKVTFAPLKARIEMLSSPQMCISVDLDCSKNRRMLFYRPGE